MMSFTLQSNGASASGVNSNAPSFPFHPPFFLAIAAAPPASGAREEASVSAVRTPEDRQLARLGRVECQELFPTWLLSVNGESEGLSHEQGNGHRATTAPSRCRS